MNQILFVITILVILLLIDVSWLKLIQGHWMKIVPSIQGSPMRIRYFAGFIVYLLLVVGMLAFVYYPNKLTKFERAFLLGFIVYGVFDMTNYALFEKYPLWMAMMDWLWGGILILSVAYMINKLLNK